MSSRSRKRMTLQDLVRVVSRYSRNDHEMGLVVADLINRGVVRLTGRYQYRKIVIN